MAVLLVGAPPVPPVPDTRPGRSGNSAGYATAFLSLSPLRLVPVADVEAPAPWGCSLRFLFFPDVGDATVPVPGPVPVVVMAGAGVPLENSRFLRNDVALRLVPGPDTPPEAPLACPFDIPFDVDAT